VIPSAQPFSSAGGASARGRGGAQPSRTGYARRLPIPLADRGPSGRVCGFLPTKLPPGIASPGNAGGLLGPHLLHKGRGVPAPLPFETSAVSILSRMVLKTRSTAVSSASIAASIVSGAT
jgi:hypothetical protein